MRGLTQSLGLVLEQHLAPWRGQAAAAVRPAICRREPTARQEIRAVHWALELRHAQRASRLEAGRRAKG